MPAFSEISPTQLMRLIGTPDAPMIVDVCLAADVSADPFVIPTSRQIPHRDILDVMPELQGRAAVVICHKGKKLSHGAAALLRARGVKAEVLEGGMVAWRDAGLPRIPLAVLPKSPLWVTRQRPKIDRIACPWLLRRFVDPRSEVLFVPSSQVLDVAEKFDAQPFDINGAEWSHTESNCSFDTFLDKFGLHTPPLDVMAHVIRAADTDTHDTAPQAAGLLALSVGLSRMYRSDEAQLEAAMPLYDALYRWARDGQDERHDWTAKGGRK